MKQKKCPQCKNLISIAAPTCLYCGRPNKFVTNEYVRSKWDKEYEKNYLNIFKIQISRKILFIMLIISIVIVISIL